MTYSPGILSIITGIVGLLLVLASSFPAARSLHERWAQEHRSISLDTTVSQRGKPGYQDEDGEASDRSMQQCTDTWQRIAIAVLSIIGSELSLSLAIVSVQSTTSPIIVPAWLLAGGWVSSFASDA